MAEEDSGDARGPMLGEVLFESRQVGDCLRVVAIDPITGVEAVAVGPLVAGAHALRRLAQRKLARRLERRGG